MKLAVILPVFRNVESLPEVLLALEEIRAAVFAADGTFLEAVFVIDGSPDHSERYLRETLPLAAFPSRLLAHSRNFGSFAAVRSGMGCIEADQYAVMAADLQEPPGLIADFARELSKPPCEIVVGRRTSREDGLFATVCAESFWRLYRWLVNPDIPPGGVDVFGCSRRVRDAVLALSECNTSLVGQLFWLGFDRTEVAYDRRRRRHGTSAWTWTRKVRYLLDSVFAFTDLPIRILTLLGGVSLSTSVVLAGWILFHKAVSQVPVPGYAATASMILFFGGLNMLGIAIVGAYAWRAYENTKARPLSLVAREQRFAGSQTPPAELP